MVDPIVTPPHPPVTVPEPLPRSVALNPPMVGVASPFDRVDGQNRDLILEAIRAWARGPLLDWATAWQSSHTEWMGSTEAWLDSWNAETSAYVQRVLDAVVGNSIELQDPVMANLVGSDSATRSALNSLYPVFRVWSGVDYPPRIPGALNIFFGPVNPGLAMTPDDRWANPNTTTLDEVIASVLDTSSALNAAVRVAAGGNRLALPLTPLGTAVTRETLGTSPNRLSAWKMPKANVNLTGSIPVPPGWNTCRFVSRWSQIDGGAGNARLYADVTAYRNDGAIAPGGVRGETSSGIPASLALKSNPFPSAITLPAGGGISVIFGRLGTLGSDTYPSDIYLVDSWLERLS